ncbi:non-homologous end-joining DNA ligase [Allorhizocola rhizosphaerae]|uniref:non-homologous end-joining DNA ligase n=1 Tax=Allorhizocola rhizosphaerae TaxID=1872709 RepID=UPI000E3D205B|nr:non-homologous end-joining DNA ligase [Allorhizocola rhizosphaerae]
MRVEVTRPDKVLFPDDGVTKADLVGYYRDIAPLMLPHLRKRPLVMFRYPDGVGGKAWVHKDIPDYFPGWIHRVEVAKEGGTVTHVVCDDADTLAYLANQACISPHVWLSKIDKLDHPDRLVFDLDPAGSFATVKTAALRLRELLDELGLPSLPMTTGSRGLHIIVRLDRSAGFDQVRAFARDVADLLAARHPATLTTEARKAKRGRRLYLDVARNGYAQTAVAPFAVRALPGAPVAAPIEWSQLDSLKSARDFTVRKPPAPWPDTPRGRSLRAAHKRLKALA